MKRSEMNLHQREAFDFVCEVMSDLIGGCENTLADNKPDSDEYKGAYTFLHSGHENLKAIVYDEVMATSSGKTSQHLRFAGKEFILERIDRRLTKWGY